MLPGAAAAWARTHELRPRTETTITDPALFVQTLEEVRAQGYAVDDQENELGVNCIALPVFLDSPLVPSGALSVSALWFRTPLPELVAGLERIRSIADAHDVRTRLQTTGS